jgi:hypothetical protein
MKDGSPGDEDWRGDGWGDIGRGYRHRRSERQAIADLAEFRG